MNELNDWRLQSCSQRCILLRKCLYILIVVFFSMITSFTSFGQTKERITLKLENMTLEQVLKRIELESGYRMLYNKDIVSTVKRITIQVNNELLATVLDKCLDGTNLSYMIKENTIIIAKKGRENRIEETAAIVKGMVKDKKGEPLVGVSVVIAGTAIGTATDVNGNFSLPVKDSTGILLFTYIGFKMQRVVFHQGKEVLVVMEEDLSELDEVTVVAYGTRKTRDVVGAISSVKADDIKEIPTASFESLLQGRMAGVEVVNQSGAPGGGGNLVFIRGYNTFELEGLNEINSNAPLYVIDGIPMLSFTSPQTGTNTIAEIDPSIIESIEVLKDAASAAIYGSRGGNGVILITTKKGKKGQSRFSANASYSYSMLPKAPKHYGGRMERDYNIAALRGYRSASMFTGKYPTSYDESKSLTDGIYDYFWNKGNNLTTTDVLRVLQDSLNPFYNNATDWYREAFRTGKIYNVNLQASGGSELLQYMIGAGYYEERGIMPGSDFNRINVNVGLNVQPAKRLSLNTRLYAAYTDRSRGGGSDASSAKYRMERLTVDPRTASSLTINSGSFKEELLEKLNLQVEKNNSYRFTANIGLAYEFIPGLTLKLNGGVDFNQQNRHFFRPKKLDVVEGRNENYIEESITRNIYILGESLLNYNFTIKEKHNFDILLGASTDKAQAFSNEDRASGTASDYIQYIKNIDPVRVTDSWGIAYYESRLFASSDLLEKTNVSYFGRIAYNYKQKYLFEATVRRDGSSVFGEDNRWATFPSVAFGWVFSDESFLKFNGLDFGKIRVSWGQSGVQFDEPYLALGVIKSGASYNGEKGMQSDGLINRHLGWEQSDQYDLGLDLDMFNYRLKFKFDYYYRYTKDKLWRVQLPNNGSIYGGQSTLWRNAMEVSNQGIEFEVTGDIFRETQVKWKTRLTLSRNWNRFEKSYSGMDEDNYIIGKPLYRIDLYKDNGFYDSEGDVPVYYKPDGSQQKLMAGINPYTVGDPRLVDVNGDGKIGIEDFVYAGTSVPKVSGGWMNELHWKDFDLNMMFTYTFGRDMFKTYAINSLNAHSSLGGQALYINTDKAKFWTEENPDDAQYPRLGSINSAGGNVMSNLEHVGYVKLKTLTLGYTLREEWRKKLGVGIRVFVTGENLFMITNYSGVDPEVVNIASGNDAFETYPLARKWTIGLTLNF
ncbi:MAG TPA: TonB-dependent receptor [Candidatus Butyricimonas faecavium]|nr:TonB-dependent receptor [Candidatus Butyricimonas faecavium]